MKILVAGGSGEVGYELSDLLCKNHQIYSTYRKNKKNSKKIIWVKADFNKRLNLNIKPDVIINCIATHSFSKKKNFIDYLNSNIISVFNLIDFAKQKKVKKIINISTISVYEKSLKKIVKENNNYNSSLLDPLAVTKSIGEKVLANSDVDYINLRLPGILCISKKNNIRPWLHLIIKQLKLNKKIKIYNSQSKFNSLIDTLEISKFIERVIRHKNRINDNFNLCSSQPIKLENLINIAKSYFNSKSKVIRISNVKTTASIISINKLKNFFNFNPSTAKNIILRNLKYY